MSSCHGRRGRGGDAVAGSDVLAAPDAAGSASAAAPAPAAGSRGGLSGAVRLRGEGAAALDRLHHQGRGARALTPTEPHSRAVCPLPRPPTSSAPATRMSSPASTITAGA